MTPENPAGGVGGAQFATTPWSVVLAVGQGDSPAAAAAMEILCRTYWYPAYAYVRRHGASPEDAQDLTQDFFLHVLERSSLRHVAREKGRFRELQKLYNCPS